MFDPVAFLSLAEGLANAPAASEAQLRTATNRAYYAAYLRAREKAKSRYGALIQLSDRKSEHYQVQDAYGSANHAEIANKLSGLFDRRRTADYDLHANIRVIDAQFAVKLGRDLLRLIERDP